MKNYLRANALLLLFTVGLVCVIYPGVLWLFGELFFPAKAAGSLITEKIGGKEVVLGSSLIAQPFTSDSPWYFQPRPSAASFNATASSPSNLGASNPKLRDRVARQLGPIVKYNPNPDGTERTPTVQQDIETWFANYQPGPSKPPLVVDWAKNYPTLAGAWIKSEENKAAAIDWLARHPGILQAWRLARQDELQKTDPKATVPEPDLKDDSTIPFDDVAVAFFESVAAAPEFKDRWLEPEEFVTGGKDDKGEPIKGKRFKPVSSGKDLLSTFFDRWLRDHPGADLKKVPADMVMTSGSGLDPHITLRNAEYQLKGVAGARAKAMHRDAGEVHVAIATILKESAFTPLSGLIGEPLVNVLELNLAIDKTFPIPSKADRNSDAR